MRLARGGRDGDCSCPGSGPRGCHGWLKMDAGARPVCGPSLAFPRGPAERSMSTSVLVFGRRHRQRRDAPHAQLAGVQKGAKARSREKCSTRPGNERYGGCMLAPLLMVSATRARCDVMSAYWGTEGSAVGGGAREVQQRTAGELIDGMTVAIGSFATCRRILRKPAHRGRPEVTSLRPKRRDWHGTTPMGRSGFRPGRDPKPP
jgi:hypothetical protein